jgi:hypothetical protein
MLAIILSFYKIIKFGIYAVIPHSDDMYTIVIDPEPDNERRPLVSILANIVSVDTLLPDLSNPLTCE